MKAGEEEEIPFEMRTKQEICCFPRKANLCGHLEQEKPIFNIHLHCRAALQPTQGKHIGNYFHCDHTEIASYYSILIVKNFRESIKQKIKT